MKTIYTLLLVPLLFINALSATDYISEIRAAHEAQEGYGFLFERLYLDHEYTFDNHEALVELAKELDERRVTSGISMALSEVRRPFPEGGNAAVWIKDLLDSDELIEDNSLSARGLLANALHVAIGQFKLENPDFPLPYLMEFLSQDRNEFFMGEIVHAIALSMAREEFLELHIENKDDMGLYGAVILHLAHDPLDLQGLNTLLDEGKDSRYYSNAVVSAVTFLRKYRPDEDLNPAYVKIAKHIRAAGILVPIEEIEEVAE